ncbi:hypothetical protein V2J09_006247 [Rumex salicifolius]
MLFPDELKLGPNFSISSSNSSSLPTNSPAVHPFVLFYNFACCPTSDLIPNFSPNISISFSNIILSPNELVCFPSLRPLSQLRLLSIHARGDRNSFSSWWLLLSRRSPGGLKLSPGGLKRSPDWLNLQLVKIWPYVDKVILLSILQKL